MPKDPFGAPLRLPFPIVACAVAGAAAAWVASSPPFATPWHALPNFEGWSGRFVYAVWLAATHAFAAYLHGRRGRASIEPRPFGLAMGTLAMSTVVPGAFLVVLFALPGKPSLMCFLDTMLPSLVPAMLAIPAVLAIGAAEEATARTPARALAVLAGCLFVPWCAGGAPGFAFGLVASLTLAAIAIGLAARAATAAGLPRLVVAREAAASYRTTPTIRLVALATAAPDPRSRGLDAVACASAAVAALGGFQLLVGWLSLC